MGKAGGGDQEQRDRIVLQEACGKKRFSPLPLAPSLTFNCPKFSSAPLHPAVNYFQANCDLNLLQPMTYWLCYSIDCSRIAVYTHTGVPMGRHLHESMKSCQKKHSRISTQTSPLIQHSILQLTMKVSPS